MRDFGFTNLILNYSRYICVFYKFEISCVAIGYFIHYRHEYVFVVYVFQANGLAAMGQYKGGTEGASGQESLFVKDHAY